jgi:hypothetical protein
MLRLRFAEEENTTVAEIRDELRRQLCSEYAMEFEKGYIILSYI